jgi:hypothetical protein
MPRANTTDDEAVVPKKRAPRKRVVVDADEAPAPRPRAPRRPRVTESPARAAEPVATETVRKAPTPLREERTRGKRSARTLLVALVLCVLVATGGVLVGMTDGGQIDVVAVVNERNEKISRGEVRDEQGNAVTMTVPVQNADTRANGGLTPMDPADSPPPPAPEPAATSTASTTKETASSTAESDVTEATPSASEVTTEPTE